MLRVATFIALAVLAMPAVAKDDVPLSPIGLPFTPDTPRRLPSDHPLHATVAVAGLDGLPDRLGPFKREAFATALRDTLGGLDMLASDPGKARFQLTPVWLGLDSPFRISINSRAVARIGWRLTRVDTGRAVFDREIETAAESSGGSAPERKRGVERVAVMSNIASVMSCLDKAAYGTAPADCALRPGFSYRAPSPPTIIFLRR